MQLAWRVGRLVLGYGCIGLGIIGLFLPILQGVLLLVIGLSLLSAESEWARRYRDHLRGWMHRQKKLTGERRGIRKHGIEG